MHLKKITFVVFSAFSTLLLSAQEVTGLHADIRKMTKETDPLKAIVIKNEIIKNYKIDTLKDSETSDLLNGIIAVAFAEKKEYAQLEKYIALIHNKFNQTSTLNIAAAELLNKNIDADGAYKIAKKTLEKYESYKDDPAARPGDYSEEDWKRLVNFAKYPYYDTYAQALFTLKRYQEALQFQEMAFNSAPEEGLPGSVERYCKLLELTGKKEDAKKLLLKVAKIGKLSKGMTEQLQSISKEEGDQSLSAFLDSLQKNTQAILVKELRPKMLNKPAPEFSLKDLTGKRVRLSGYKGKIVVLDLWATWCTPCIASFPAMQKEIEKHPDVVFLFIAVQEKGHNIAERVKTFIKKHKYSFYVLLDEPVSHNSDKYIITSSYKPEGIPAKYFIDKNGKLQFQSQGFDSDSQLINEMDAMITILKAQ